MHGGYLLSPEASFSSPWISRMIPIDNAHADPEGLALLLDRRYARAAAAFAGAALVVDDPQIQSNAPRWVHPQPRALRQALCAQFYPAPAPLPSTVSHGRGVIAADVRVGEDVVLGAFSCIGSGTVLGRGCVVGANVIIEHGCWIGDGCVIEHGAYLGPRVRLGVGCVIGPHACLGQAGFGLEPDAQGHLQKLPHIGGVYLEDDVQIGANTCIDAGTFLPTFIGQGTRIDNLVHIAHNVRIGRDCLLLAQVGIAGSAVIEDHCILAGQVGVAGHLRIGHHSQIAAQSGVAYDCEPHSRLGGSPAFELRRWQRSSILLQTLDRRLQLLEQRLPPSSFANPDAEPPDASPKHNSPDRDH
jgi:UDP-3-O-[3-hydroxymyristoyl] glucosamine N-acyltransferase